MQKHLRNHVPDTPAAGRHGRICTENYADQVHPSTADHKYFANADKAKGGGA